MYTAGRASTFSASGRRAPELVGRVAGWVVSVFVRLPVAASPARVNQQPQGRTAPVAANPHSPRTILSTAKRSPPIARRRRKPCPTRKTQPPRGHLVGGPRERFLLVAGRWCDDPLALMGASGTVFARAGTRESAAGAARPPRNR